MGCQAQAHHGGWMEGRGRQARSNAQTHHFGIRAGGGVRRGVGASDELHRCRADLRVKFKCPRGVSAWSSAHSPPSPCGTPDAAAWTRTVSPARTCPMRCSSWYAVSQTSGIAAACSAKQRPPPLSASALYSAMPCSTTLTLNHAQANPCVHWRTSASALVALSHVLTHVQLAPSPLSASASSSRPRPRPRSARALALVRVQRSSSPSPSPLSASASSSRPRPRPRPRPARALALVPPALRPSNPPTRPHRRSVPSPSSLRPSTRPALLPCSSRAPARR